MECPQCNKHRLEPFELEIGLIACRCMHCEGVLLPLMNYRYWIDNNPSVEISIEEDSVVEDQKQAKICPKCTRLMTKFKIGVDSKNRLELCSSCDEVWLDSGEWQLLKSLDIHDQLPSIFTEAWQRNIRAKKQAESLKQSYESQIGEESFAKVDAFKEWLDGHERKSSIIQYLGTKIY